MKNVVLITGGLATGKSTLANSLSNSLNYSFISKDSIKEIICDSVGFSNREENKRISVAAVNSMIYFLKQSLLKGNSVILEANFRLDEIDTIAKICDDLSANLKIICLTGNPKIIYQRFLSRVPNRHKAHLSIGLDKDYDKFVEYNSQLYEQITNLDFFEIDAVENNEKEVLEKALNYIRAK